MSLQLQDLTRTFGTRVAVDRVTFTVPDGLLTGFVGGNGAGKTTTMRMLMGLLAADAGSITRDGEPLTDADRRRIGYLPEERGLYPKQRVVDQLVYLGELAGMPSAAARAAVADWLARFGLADRAKDRVEKLSLGNQQRVQIIAALMLTPTALILDEPFSGLDPGAVDAMADVLRAEAARGIPVLFSSHQLDLVERLCDRLVILRDGRVVAEGTVEELRSAGPRRWRLVLDGADADAGWVRGAPGVTVLDVDGRTALVEPHTPDDAHALLAAAVERGPVREFAQVVPSLTEIYREVSS